MWPFARHPYAYCVRLVHLRPFRLGGVHGNVELTPLLGGHVDSESRLSGRMRRGDFFWICEERAGVRSLFLFLSACMG